MTIISISLIVIYFIWMDIILYNKVQNIQIVYKSGREFCNY